MSGPRNPVTVIAKAILAVGGNLQRGLVGAVSEIAGVGPRGQAPSGATSGLALSLSQSASRRITGVRTVASGARHRPVPQEELTRQWAAYHAEAVACGTERAPVVAALWKSEGLATTIAKYALPGNSLRDAAILPQVLPVAHVGFGSGSAELLSFDAARLNASFDDLCVPQYREFSYEGVGAMLRAYERGFFKLMTHTAGLIPFDAPEGPDPAGFFADYLDGFPSDIQRLMAHGYGRIVAFSHMDVYRAIQDATKLPAGRVEPVVQGIAFAFAMINSADLPWLLRRCDVPFEPPVRAAFQDGLTYSLVFLEWFVPGLLAAWQPYGGLETSLVERARRDSALAVERGFPLAFRLATPARVERSV